MHLFLKRFLLLLVLTGVLLVGCSCRKSDTDSDVKEATQLSEVTTKRKTENTTETTEAAKQNTEQKKSEAAKEDRRDPGVETDYIRLMPNVTLDMLQADFWTERRKGSSEEMMDSEEIKAFNKSIIYEKSDLGYYQKYAAKDGARSIKGADLKSIMDESDFSEQVYYKDGEALSSGYWENIYANENYSGLRDKNPIRYGFTVRRSNMRLLPTDEVVSAEREFTFYDELQISSLLLNEPVVILHTSTDREWYLVMSIACSGWVHAEDVAISESYEEWDRDRKPEDFLIFTEDKVDLEFDPMNEEASELQISMGVKLPLDQTDNYRKSKEGREAYENYVVKIPTRDPKGNLAWKHAFVPVSRGVHYGYLTLTQENIIEVAFHALGARYGWGGMYNARDCSLYIMDVYRCFGIYLPRNTSGMKAMQCKTIDVSDYSDEEKKNAIKDLPIGSILLIQGHAMLYLGEVDGKYYIISASASTVLEPEDSDYVTMVESVVISDLSMGRRNGGTWLRNIETLKIIQFK